MPPIDPKGVSRPSSNEPAPRASEKLTAADKVDAGALGLELPPDASREERVRFAERMKAAARTALRGHQPDAQAALKVTPTMPRDPEMEKDPTVVWTGTHYQLIGI